MGTGPNNNIYIADWANNRGYGMVITWPAVEGSLEAHGNAGMVQTIQNTAYSLAYIGVGYAADIANAGLGTAWLKNQSGNFLLPTKEAVQAAAAELGSRTPPDERLTIVLSPGEAAYPLVSYEYAIVSTSRQIRRLRLRSASFCFGRLCRVKQTRVTSIASILSDYRPIFGS